VRGLLRALLLLIALGPSFAGAQGSRSVTIGASGDVLVHLRVISAAEHAERRWDHVLGALSTVVEEREIAFANLESPLSMIRPPESGEPPVLGAPPEVAAALARAGLDVLSLANNHSYDQWARGMADTREAVLAAGMVAIGAGRDLDTAHAAQVIERDGTRIAFLAITERVNGRPGDRAPPSVIARWTDDAVIEAALARARAGADALVVSIHWSHDFWEAPTHAQRARARWRVDGGADVILGHGPHVLHEVERMSSARGDAICAYSLGNLISNQGMRYRVGRTSFGDAHRATYVPAARDGVWLRTAIEIDPGGRLRITRLEGVPLFTYNNYVARFERRETEDDIRIARLRDVPDPALRDERRAAIAAALGPAVTLVE
jgi:poly-gamma-glutamate capsule biosynthesis protein CapA/YwtB (metallophosphatase superfamily)